MNDAQNEPKPRITLSYRRSDSEAITGRIHDHLVSHFGEDSVFIDIDSIPPMVDFREYIDQELKKTKFFLVVMGQQWLGPRGDGTYRINDDDDPVRVEAASAIRNGLKIFPLLVGGAAMPTRGMLPDELKKLSNINGLEVSSGVDFRAHVRRAIKYIEDFNKADHAQLAAEEADRQRLAAAAAEQQRLLAEAAEGARLAAEAAAREREAAQEMARRRLAAEEAERQQRAADEKERVRLLAEEAERTRLTAEQQKLAEKMQLAEHTANRERQAAKRERRVAALAALLQRALHIVRPRLPGRVVLWVRALLLGLVIIGVVAVLAFATSVDLPLVTQLRVAVGLEAENP